MSPYIHIEEYRVGHRLAVDTDLFMSTGGQTAFETGKEYPVKRVYGTGIGVASEVSPSHFIAYDHSWYPMFRRVL